MAADEEESTYTAAQLRLTRKRILQTALAMADRKGLEALSMRRIAQELGVKAMSLYNHVASKEDIIDRMVDMVVAEIELPSPANEWKHAMRRRGVSAHEVLLKHPWATPALISRVNTGPAVLRYIDATLGCLRHAGFSYELADYAWNAMDNHIYGFTLQELNFPFEPSEYSAAAARFIEQVPTEEYPYFTELTQLVVEGRHSGVYDFTFGLDLIIDGLERYRRK